MKKLTLAKETLRRLSTESLGFVQGGLPVETYTCVNCLTDNCATGDCTAVDCHILPTATRTTATKP